MRVLTGLQPSGKLHIGNYFGAIQPALELQQVGEPYYFIADYHAMTSVSSPAELRDFTFELAVDFLAAGLNPERSVIFRQSAVPEVHELAWILSTVCPMGLLERCHSFKDKVAKGIAANHALFAYPALMAADILLYDTALVPVGKDQKQHLEVTRDLAQKINERFGEGTLVVPEVQIREVTAAVPGLDGAKMSKSYGNTLPLDGEEKPLRKSVMRIPTDSTPLEEPKPTENSLILDLYRLFATPEQLQTMISDFEKGGTGYGDFKKRLFEAYWDYFADFRRARAELLTNRDHVEAILADGANRARSTATTTLDRVRKAVGLS